MRHRALAANGGVDMQYQSTRGNASNLDFRGVTLAGLASDGGLYVPQVWPRFTADEIAAMRGLPYVDLAAKVMAPFTAGSLTEAELRDLCAAAYGSFSHDAVTPLVQLNEQHWLLELFHGPTLAFKDVALQLLGQFFERFLSGTDTKLTIVGATSGDTGSAAIDAVAGRAQIEIFMLHPHNRVSDVQRRQMTTPAEANVHALAMDGDFDDCQGKLKDMFNHFEFRDAVGLAGVNSINWARVLAQVVYYFTAAVTLGAPDRKISFTVPTGNFGDIFAGYIAKSMGLPIEKLVVATNQNDILHRCLSTGRYEMDGVKPSISPSMDIQISSNFERLLYEAYGRDASAIRTAMEGQDFVEVETLPGRWPHAQDLVGADAEMPVGQPAVLRVGQTQASARLVEHDEIVARALHFGEPDVHGRIIRPERCAPAGRIAAAWCASHRCTRTAKALRPTPRPLCAQSLCCFVCNPVHIAYKTAGTVDALRQTWITTRPSPPPSN